MGNLFQIARLGGAHVDDCVLLVNRSPYEDFADFETTEWLVVRKDAVGLRIVGNGQGRANAMWVSPSGRIHVVATHEGLHGLHVGVPNVNDYSWSRVTEVDPVGITLVENVWGLSDECIFAWAGPVLKRYENNPAVTWFFDGNAWRTLYAPGRIHVVQGTSRDLIFAVGYEGLIARWQDSAWQVMQSPAPLSFEFLQVIDANKVYAAASMGYILEGSIYGWSLLAKHEHQIFGLVKWQDRMLVATKDAGFLALEGNQLVPFVEHLRASLVHAGQSLMWVTTSGVMETVDFESFKLLSEDELSSLLQATHWNF